MRGKRVYFFENLIQKIRVVQTGEATEKPPVHGGFSCYPKGPITGLPKVLTLDSGGVLILGGIWIYSSEAQHIGAVLFLIYGSRHWLSSYSAIPAPFGRSLFLFHLEGSEQKESSVYGRRGS